jgi:DNA polymerase-3 subunit gamma/tau
VYLIDEVHMLTTSSFNSQLKTLEEPPPHVKFLLATTDPQKLPATVLSRCLQFNLKNMPPELIVGHLKYVLEQEMVSFDEPALWLLGRAADGSMRDALSLTDQAIAFGSGKLAESDIRAMLGTVDLSFVYKLTTAVSQQDAAATLSVVEDMSEYAPDYGGSLQEMASLLHRVAIAQAVPAAVDNSWGDAEQVVALAASITAEDAQLYYQMAVTGRRDLGLAPDLRSGFEMALLRMIAFRPVAVIDQQLAPQDLQESPVEVAAQVKKSEVAQRREPDPVAEPQSAPVPQSAPEPQPAPELQPVPEPQSAAEPQAAAQPAAEPQPAAIGKVTLEPARWAELLERLPLNGILLSIASHCELRQVDGARAYLVLDEENASLYNEKQGERIASAMADYLGRDIEVHIEVGSTLVETPAARTQRMLDERLAQAVASIESDPRVQLLIDRFEGTLDRESITPIKH